MSKFNVYPCCAHRCMYVLSYPLLCSFTSQNLVERGMYKFTIGPPDTLVDFLHINNLVQAHRLAGEALQHPQSIAVSPKYSNNLIFRSDQAYVRPPLTFPFWQAYCCFTYDTVYMSHTSKVYKVSEIHNTAI